MKAGLCKIQDDARSMLVIGYEQDTISVLIPHTADRITGWESFV